MLVSYQHHLFVLHDTAGVTGWHWRVIRKSSGANVLRKKTEQPNKTRLAFFFFFFSFLHGDAAMNRLKPHRMESSPPPPHPFSVTPLQRPLSRGVPRCPSPEWRQRFPDSLFSFFVLLPFAESQTKYIPDGAAQGSNQTNQTTCATAHRNSTKKTNQKKKKSLVYIFIY